MKTVVDCNGNVLTSGENVKWVGSSSPYRMFGKILQISCTKLTALVHLADGDAMWLPTTSLVIDLEY